MLITYQGKPKFFQNQDFKTIQMKVIFPFERCSSDIAKCAILPGLLHTMCLKYPTEASFALEGKRLYVLANYCLYNTIGDTSYFEFNFMVPDTESLRKDLLEEQMKFFHEMIYHPKVKKHSFDSIEFQREVDNLRMDMEKLLKDPTGYTMVHAKEKVDDGGFFSDTIFNHQEQIDEVTPETLYEFYLKTIYQNKPLVYFFGNCPEQELELLSKKYFYLESFQKISFSIELNHYLKPRKTIQDLMEKSSFQNSVMIYFYKIKQMKKKDEVLMGVVKELLNSLSSRLLNKKLRDEFELVYSSFAVCYASYGVFCIMALIHKDSQLLVREKIVEALNDLKNQDMIAPLLDNIKERHRVSLIRKLDDKTSLFQDAIFKDMGLDLTEEDFYKKLIDITPVEVSKFIDRMIIDTIYYLEEGEHE